MSSTTQPTVPFFLLSFFKSSIHFNVLGVAKYILSTISSPCDFANRSYTGKSGFSGEFGHVNVFDNEILCHCGKKGCLETEASGSALHRILLERIGSGESSILSKRTAENPPTLDEIITAVNKEDLLCIEIVEEIGQKLGRQIAGLISIFNPELVIIGGTLSSTGDYIVQPIKTAIRKYSLNLVNKDATVTVSKLKDKAGVVGACMLARSRMFEI